MLIKNYKGFTFVAIAVATAVAGYLLMSPASVKSTDKTYNGTLYVAGMGGHFAKAEVTINPHSETPITVNSLDRIELGAKETHPVHDGRIDVGDGNTMFWSTYKLDKSVDGKKVHVGKVNLATGEVLKDVLVDVDSRAHWTGANYCGSGQSKDFYMPITMTHEGYIDVFDKQSLERKHRVFLDQVLGYKNYKFIHGTNSPDMKHFYIVVNKAESAGPTDAGWVSTGEIDVMLLDLPALEKGEVKVLKRNTITGGNPNTTATFRMHYTPDGRYILQSAADMFYLIDAKSLELLARENRQDGANHDAISTPDGRYAILTLRKAVPYLSTEEKITDGLVQLYDIEKRQLVGKSTSTCYPCHKEEGIETSAVLCGIQASWK